MSDSRKQSPEKVTVEVPMTSSERSRRFPIPMEGADPIEPADKTEKPIEESDMSPGEKSGTSSHGKADRSSSIKSDKSNKSTDEKSGKSSGDKTDKSTSGSPHGKADRSLSIKSDKSNKSTDSRSGKSSGGKTEKYTGERSDKYSSEKADQSQWSGDTDQSTGERTEPERCKSPDSSGSSSDKQDTQDCSWATSIQFDADDPKSSGSQNDSASCKIEGSIKSDDSDDMGEMDSLHDGRTTVVPKVVVDEASDLAVDTVIPIDPVALASPSPTDIRPTPTPDPISYSVPMPERPKRPTPPKIDRYSVMFTVIIAFTCILGVVYLIDISYTLFVRSARKDQVELNIGYIIGTFLFLLAGWALLMYVSWWKDRADFVICTMFFYIVGIMIIVFLNIMETETAFVLGFFVVVCILIRVFLMIIIFPTNLLLAYARYKQELHFYKHGRSRPKVSIDQQFLLESSSSQGGGMAVQLVPSAQTARLVHAVEAPQPISSIEEGQIPALTFAERMAMIPSTLDLPVDEDSTDTEITNTNSTQGFSDPIPFDLNSQASSFST